MIAYPTGHEPDFWDPVPEENDFRFALGRTAGSSTASPPLIAICMNPSHARRREADKTVRRLIEASQHHRYAGWVMLNLYPERSPKPSDLTDFDAGLSAENCAAIERVLAKHGATEVLGGWGNAPHPTLRRARLDVLTLLGRLRVRVFTFDSLTKPGNPRHPSPPGNPLPMLGPKVYLT